MGQLEELVLVLARSLVDEPDKVEVWVPRPTRAWTSSSGWPQDDMGKIIGRQGRTIRAIRTVAKAASVKLGKIVWRSGPGRSPPIRW